MRYADSLSKSVLDVLEELVVVSSSLDRDPAADKREVVENVRFRKLTDHHGPLLFRRLLRQLDARLFRRVRDEARRPV